MQVKALDEEIFQETGSRLFSVSDMKEWEDFGNTAPSSLTHVPQDQRTTFKDFCACATTEPTPSAMEVEQLELVEWKDPEKQGRGSSKGRLGKERLERKKLKATDVPIDTFVATVPHPDDDQGLKRTLFNIGKVTSHIPDSSNGPSVMIWWCGCFFNGTPTTDVNGEWAPLCKGGHQFTGRCLMGKCGTGSQGGKWLDEIPLSEVMLANVKLKKTDGRIWAASMKGLARCSAELCAGTQLVLSFDDQTQKLVITDGHCQPYEGE